MAKTNNNSSILNRFPQGLSLQQELDQSFPCPYCGTEVYWNQRAIHRKTGRQMICDAINGGPHYNQGHYCSILFELRQREKYERESLNNFIASVRPTTLQALLSDKLDERVSVGEQVNIVFKIKKEEKKKNKNDKWER